MAVKYGFFDASYDEQTGKFDRQYFSEDMSKFFNVITGNGVFKNDRNALEVVANGTSMNVQVSTGYATALGRYIDVTEPYELTLTAPSENSRIDMIVARMSVASNERNFTLIVKQGVAAASPVPPTLVRNSSVYELCLAKVTLTSNTVLITQNIIEDTRADKDLCGYVSGLGGGGDAEIIDCTIKNGETVYSSTWLLDENGSTFQPEEKKLYRVITDGKYNDCLYVFDESQNKYEGVGSYNLELSVAETLAIWSNSQAIILENVPAPTGSLQYNGSEQSPTWLYYDSTKIRMGGTTAATNAGVYHTTFEPINGYTWSDGTVSVKDVTWTITKKLVPIPVPLQTIFNYDGYQKEVPFDNLDITSVIISNGSATNTGDYVVTAELRDIVNTSWIDDTYVQMSWIFKIVGQQNSVTLSKSSVTFAASTDTDTVTVSATSLVSVEVESTDEKIVTATVNGSTITLAPGPTLTKGDADVIVRVKGAADYAEGVATISVSKTYGIKYVTWADGTDQEILEMVQAADNGDIDLRDYWNVGDERVVRLSDMAASGSNDYGNWAVGESHAAQNIIMVLMDTDRCDLTDAVLDINGNPRYKCSFVVGMKGTLLENGYLNTNYEYYRYWGESSNKRRIWCNRAFAGAMPTTLMQAFKSFKVGARGEDANRMYYTDDLFALFAISEITDEMPENYDEAEWNALLPMFQYYDNEANRIKVYGTQGGTANYWTRSTFVYKQDKGSTRYQNGIYVDKEGNPIGEYEHTGSIANECYPPMYHALSLYGCI